MKIILRHNQIHISMRAADNSYKSCKMRTFFPIIAHMLVCLYESRIVDTNCLEYNLEHTIFFNFLIKFIEFFCIPTYDNAIHFLLDFLLCFKNIKFYIHQT